MEESGTSLFRHPNGEKQKGRTKVNAKIDASVEGKDQAVPTIPDPMAMTGTTQRSTKIGVEGDTFAKVEGESPMNLHRNVAMIGHRESLSRVSLLVAKPSTLLEVVFPWDCKDTSCSRINHGRTEQPTFPCSRWEVKVPRGSFPWKRRQQPRMDRGWWEV